MMRFLVSPVLAILLAFQAASCATAQNYAYIPEEGGLVDLTSDPDAPLVWAAGQDLEWLINDNGVWSYDWALNFVPGYFIDNGFGAGYTDWRVPTVAEMQDAAAKGVYQALCDVALAEDVGQPYVSHYWSSDAPFKSKGRWLAYKVNLETGVLQANIIEGYGIVILVRGAPPPPPPPSSPPKGPKK